MFMHVPRMRRIALLLCVFIPLLLFTTPSIAQHVSKSAEIHSPDFPKLISDLGSDNFATREKASKELRGNDQSLAALRDALKSSDAEVAERADKILKELTHEIEHRPLLIATNLAKIGKVDWAVEMLAGWQGPNDDPALWQAALTLGWILRDRYNRSTTKTVSLTTFDLPPRELYQYDKLLHGRTPVILDPNNLPKEMVHGPLYHGSKSFKCPYLHNGVLILSGGVKISTKVSNGFVFANESVVIDELKSSIIFSTERVTIDTIMAESVIIAGEAISCPQSVASCTLIAGGSIGSNKGMGGTLFTGENQLVSSERKKPLDFVTRFEVTDLGLHLAENPSGFSVCKLDPGTALNSAGLKPIDSITAVDGVKIKDSVGLRKQLRKASVRDCCTITVKRGEKMIDLTVDFKEDRKRLLKETTRIVEKMERRIR